jgi:pilus assembly protein CpaB
MQRRVIAAIAAVLLAGIGAVLLYSYVTNADKRAMAGQEATNVLVVTKEVPTGTMAENIAPFVEVRQLPKVAVVPGALTTITEVAGLATTTDLQIGEQLLAARFATPGTTTTGQVSVPTDKQVLSILLEPQRLVGGTIAAGDKVGMFVTVADETHLLLNDVLVTNIQGGLDPAATDKGAAPAGAITVSLALDAKDAELVVFAIEKGSIWLSRETPESDKSKTHGVNVKNVFK